MKEPRANVTSWLEKISNEGKHIRPDTLLAFYFRILFLYIIDVYAICMHIHIQMIEMKRGISNDTRAIGEFF